MSTVHKTSGILLLSRLPHYEFEKGVLETFLSAVGQYFPTKNAFYCLINKMNYASTSNFSK